MPGSTPARRRGVRERLHEALDSGEGDLILDLSKLEMIDATGLGVLVGAHRRAISVRRRLVLRGCHRGSCGSSR
ncbi:STAS domain-containing protein [Nonomuraea salmonea]|uniref:STAS domain-containing protein n=1 Tax=Nonomuraea salmonea TaxID=46181 RepID=UPI0031ED406D